MLERVMLIFKADSIGFGRCTHTGTILDGFGALSCGLHDIIGQKIIFASIKIKLHF
jgi:hypothetical protein